MKKHLLATFVAAMIPLSSHAEIKISGFGTLAAGKAFGYEETVDDYYDDIISLRTSNTFLGLQANIDIYGDLDATIQTKSAGDDKFDTELTWAFLSYDVTDEWRIIAGRQRMPHYTYSDYLDVSYAYHWIQVPSELYNAPFDSFNGISTSYTFNFDSSSLTAQILYGEESDVEDGDTKDFSDIMGGKLVYNYDWLTITGAYFEFEQSSTSTRPGRPGESDETITTVGVLKSADLGIQADYNDWLVIAEITSVDLSDLGSNYGTKQPWMLSIAKRFGNIMPHVTYGQNRNLDFGDEDSITPFYVVGVRFDLDIEIASAIKVEYSGEEDSDGNTSSSAQVAFVTAF